MKAIKSLLVVVLIFLTVRVSAQYVPISPDFANYIGSSVDPFAISGGNLDTTNITIISLQDLTIANTSSVSDITGIKYFKSLQNLHIINSGSNAITSLPELPTQLETLEVSDNITQNSITNITDFPSSLLVIKLRNTCVSSWPALPPNLHKLILDYSCMTALPVLPNTLDTLHVNYCYDLSSLPSVLPSALKVLQAASCSFPSVPDLPPGMEVLDVNSNVQLSQIGLLNYGIQTIDASLTSISGFQNNLPSTIYYLDIAGTFITSLPALPDTMAWLNISNTPITSLNNIPHYVHYLGMDSVPSLTSLPNFPSVCNGLNISRNLQLPVDSILASMVFNDSVYSAFDSTLMNPSFNQDGRLYYYTYPLQVSARGNNLTRIPVNRSRFVSQYTSPGSYTEGRIDFADNRISSVDPSWFSNISTVILANNLITSFTIDTSVYSYISYIDLSQNLITTVGTLPTVDLPSGIWPFKLNLSNNRITDIQPTISFRNIELQNNLITCLPYISSITEELRVANNPISCVPNLPIGMYLDTALNVCQQGNINNCERTGSITGIVFHDINGNGTFDSGDTILPNIEVDAVMTNNRYVVAHSDSTGVYTLSVPLNTVDTVTAWINGVMSTITTPPIYSNITVPWQVDSNRNIGLQFTPPPPYDLALTLSSYTDPRPGFHYTYHIDCENLGSQFQDGNIVFSFDPTLFYQFSYPSGVVSGSTITWPIANMQPGQHLSFDIGFNIPASVALGTIIGASAVANSNYTDTNLLNNFDSISAITIGSYDPNDKRVQPETLSQAQIDSFTYLTYTIRFQNTGTASAINISVTDTLSNLLDLRTLKVTTASHAYNYTFSGRVLTVNFPNINLLDSNANEALSHGFFTYKIKLDSSFDNSKTVSNTAYIYFDFNAAVVTNTTRTGKITSISEVREKEGNLKLFPNPTYEVLNIAWEYSNDNNTRVEIVNTLGRSIETFVLPEKSTYQLSVKNYPPGLYLIRYYGNDKSAVRSQRFVVGH